jgi:ARG/rhodanese/phosphatase superfamily protein
VVTDKNDAESSTGAFTAMGNKKEVSNKIDEYKKYFKSLLASDTRIIGMAVVTGDSILGCDMFATHALLMNHADNLITSYATEVITSGKKITVPFVKVKSYMDTILSDETKQEQLIKQNGTMLKEKNSKLHITVY